MAADLPVAAAKRDPRFVQPGTLIYRKSDVDQALHRAMRHAREALRVATIEGRETDAQMNAIRVRALSTAFADIRNRAPVFENSTAAALAVCIPERRPGEAA